MGDSQRPQRRTDRPFGGVVPRGPPAAARRQRRPGNRPLPTPMPSSTSAACRHQQPCEHGRRGETQQIRRAPATVWYRPRAGASSDTCCTNHRRRTPPPARGESSDAPPLAQPPNRSIRGQLRALRALSCSSGARTEEEEAKVVSLILQFCDASASWPGHARSASSSAQRA